MPVVGERTRELESPLARVSAQVKSVVAVPDDTLELLLIALLARGHALIEGVPGIGKTLLARTLARSLDLDTRRIQFTNDLMPADIVGASIWKSREGVFEFVPGPLFSNVVLADEVNRTSPRTLSCLLEAMETGHATVDGETRRLADPFLVLATRNPIEFHGTYPIPEAALDRFLVRVELRYPDVESELRLYRGDEPSRRLATLTPALSRSELMRLMDAVGGIAVSEAVTSYAYRVVSSTRRHSAVALGASPRAAMSWLRAARARALIHGREYVLPDDLKALAAPVLGHRVFPTGGGDARPIVQEVLETHAVDL